MNTVDPIAALIAELERPVAPRPEFRATLRARLLEELASRPSSSSDQGFRRSWSRVRISWRLRLALVLFAVLLLLAGIATATYLGVHTWVSAGPGGVQYESGYRLATVFATPADQAGGPWTGAALGPHGHDLYVLRWAERAGPELVRISRVDRRTGLRATRVVDLSGIGGLRLHGGDGLVSLPEKPGECCAPQQLALAPNGDVFVLATRREALDPHAPRGDIALFVLRRNGTRQRVLGLEDLLGAKVLARAPRGIALGVVATASDRLWLRADSFGRGDSYEFRLLEIVDPNHDGDWRDRVVHRIVLPQSLSAAVARPRWVQLAAEPALPGDDRSRSVLLTVGRRIYRIADWNGDGDALDKGEARLVLGRSGGGSAVVAPRVIRVHGRTRRELVAGGLTQLDRVSIVSPTGRVTDIARSFPGGGVQGVLAGPHGAIYVLSCCWTVYRLEPSTRGPRAGSTGTSVSVMPPSPPEAAPASAGSTIVVRTSRGTFAVDADGSGRRRLGRGAADCFSADGHLIAYTAEAEAPGETFVYVANANGSRPRKVAESGSPLCPFSSRWLVLDSWPTLVRHDLRTGREVEIAHDVGVDAPSPDGSRLAYSDSRGALTLVDVGTLRRRRLAAAPAGASFTTLGTGPLWSPDGTRIAYLTGPRWTGGAELVHHRYRYDLWVRDVSSGAVVVRRSFAGRWPSFAWSPDATQLLLCVKVRGGGLPSCGGATVRRSPYTTPPARLLLVTLSDPSTHALSRGQLVFAGWAPLGGALAYGTWDGLYVRTPDGETKKLAAAPGGRWPAGDWLGWSPDGRYIAVHGWPSKLITVELATGKVRRIDVGSSTYSSLWWRR